MQPFRLARWGLVPRGAVCVRRATSLATATEPPKRRGRPPKTASTEGTKLTDLPSPHPSQAHASAKLTALHARLGLSKKLPLEVLARCLVDRTADADYRFNNVNLAAVGSDLLGYYMSEHLICRYPRLPMVVLEAAVKAYIGAQALSNLLLEWGVEAVAEPGGEVDPGYLQFRRTPATNTHPEIAKSILEYTQERTGTMDPQLSTIKFAGAAAARAVFGSVYLYGGAEQVKDFFSSHILSRHLDLNSLFTFVQPTRDLSRLCAREGFESPVARLVSETGRQSRSPVFVVGVYSGRDKIGEDSGSSLNEARFKAAAKALKGWYLYSPQVGEIMVPSMMEVPGKRVWQKPHIDDGEVVV